MKLRELLIDDRRTFNNMDIARRYSDGIVLLSKNKYDILWLDHDLGEENKMAWIGRTGYDIMNWLEANQDRLPKIIICVSDNPVGREKINSVIKIIYGKIFTMNDVRELEKWEQKA